MSEGDEFGWSTDLESVRPRRHALPTGDRPLLSRRAARELAERTAVNAEPVPEATVSWVPTEHWTTAELAAVVQDAETSPFAEPVHHGEPVPLDERVEPAAPSAPTFPSQPTVGAAEPVLGADPRTGALRRAASTGANGPGGTATRRRILETGPLRFDLVAQTDGSDAGGARRRRRGRTTESDGVVVADHSPSLTPDPTPAPKPRLAPDANPAPNPSREPSGSGSIRKKPNPGRNLPQAIAVGVGLAGAALLSLLVRKEAFVALASAAVVVGVWELSHALTHRKLHIPVIPLAVGSVGMLVSAFVARGEGLFAALLLTAFGVLLWRLIDGVQGAGRDVAAGVFAAVYVPFLAGWAIIMLAAPDGAQRVMVYVATVVASDVGGYAAGVLFGRHPMSPTISPKKSWEGFAGSVLVCALVASAGVTLLLHGPIWAGAVLGPLVAVTATAGDLCESLIKRDLGVKDMGTVLPGHGGIMDRLDSMLFSAPAVYLALLLLVSSR